MARKELVWTKRVIQDVINELRVTKMINLNALAERTGMSKTTLYVRILKLKADTGVYRYKKIDGILHIDKMMSDRVSVDFKGDNRPGRYHAYVIPKGSYSKVWVVIRGNDERDVREQLVNDYNTDTIIKIVHHSEYTGMSMSQ